MIIKIDNRETDLIQNCQHFLKNPIYKDIELIIEALPIGDVILINNNISSLESTTEKVIIERKSLRDLAASIKDGRYEEQSYRLSGIDHPNHNIVYLIEGDLNKFNMFKDRMDKMPLYSAMVSLNYFKGFSVFRTLNIEESALVICNMAYKIEKSEREGKKPYYSNHVKSSASAHLNENISPESSSTEDKNVNQIEEAEKEESDKDYCAVVKKIKKENVTTNNIGEIMLCQIPGISSTTALAIMNEFKTLPELIVKIKEDKECLKNLSYTNEKGQTRKINRTSLSNIIKYLS